MIMSTLHYGYLEFLALGGIIKQFVVHDILLSHVEVANIDKSDNLIAEVHQKVLLIIHSGH